MSKELTSLEWLNYYKDKLRVSGQTIRPNGFDIIETALKEKEQQDDVFNILKEIIEFGRVLPHIEPNKDNGFDIMSAVGINIQRDIENKERELLRQWVLETCFPKELKALEIIKIEMPNLTLLASCVNYETYKEKSGDNLTKEEYDLLKEVLL